MSDMGNAVYIVNGARTPFGAFGGGLSTLTATELGTVASKATLKRANVDAHLVDNVVFGNVMQTHNGAAYLARHVALETGIPETVPAVTVNRLCGSGLEAVIAAAKDIWLGTSEVALAGGAESMSLTPYLARGVRFGLRMGDSPLTDMLSEVLTDCRGNIPMGITAENLAGRYHITRREQDECALLSHQRAETARKKGIFREEIAPVQVGGKRGTVEVSEDEHIRPDTSLPSLEKLRPAFQKDGTVTAGNSSGINDGACAVVVAGQKAVDQYGMEPMARIVSYGVSGVDPAYMGIGPVPAIKMTLHRAGLNVEDIDLWEVNEAFAAQYLSVEKELGLLRDITNVNGGAIALGHPVGASGARLLLTLALELRRRQGRFGIASLCIGGGQGIALVIERVH